MIVHRTAVVLACLMSAVSAAQDAQQMALARDYVSSRTGVLKIPEGSRGFTPGPNEQRLFALVASDFLKRHPRGDHWNAEHPEWKRIAAIIEGDMRELISGVADSAQAAAVSKQVNEAFVNGMAGRLTAPELVELTAYYSSGLGVRFAGIQARLFDRLSSGLMDMQGRMLSGQRLMPSEPRPDPRDVKELLGLFDELVRIQWAIADPGPGKDRSGLQALPMAVAAGVQAGFNDLNAIWREMPEPDRAAILAWRASPLAQKERAAIFEVAKGIRQFFAPEALMDRLTSAMSKYDEKWRSLIEAAAP